MPKILRISTLCAGLLFSVQALAQSPALLQTQVLRSAAELEQYLKAGANPLDAFTPYGRRDFLRNLCWGERGSCGLSYGAIQRELTAEQARAVASLFGAESYLHDLISTLDQTQPLRLSEPNVDLERRYLAMRDEISTINKQEHASGGYTQREFQSLITHYVQAHATELAQLDRLSASDLVLLFDGVSALAELSLDEAMIAQQQKVYAHMRSRHLDTQRGLDDSVLRPLMHLRMYDEIAQLQARFPSLHKVTMPKVEDQLGKDFVGRSVYRYESDGNRLVREAFGFAQGKQLLMVVGAGCHFSRDAMAHLNNDVGFAQLARDAHLVLLTPPASAAPTFMLNQWNRAHPQWPLLVASNRKEWAEFDRPSVPIFYVVEDGKIVQQVVGWAGEKTVATLKTML